MNKILGISLIVLALGIAIVPSFTHCRGTGMPCEQSAAAEIAIGAPLGVAGASALFNTKKKGLLSLSLIGMALGVSAILIPTSLIGTCPGAPMHCNVYMKPLIIGMGLLTVSVGLVGLMAFRNSKD